MFVPTSRSCVAVQSRNNSSPAAPAHVPSPRFLSLEAFGRRPQCSWHRLRWAVIRNPYMSTNLSRPFRTQVVSFCSAPCGAILPSRPAVSQGRRAQGQSRMAVALIVPRAAGFPGHSLTGPSTTAGSGASGLAARWACFQNNCGYTASTRRISNNSRLPWFLFVWSAFSRSSVDVHGLVR